LPSQLHFIISTFFLFEEFKMPIYEYRCDNCGHGLEKIQKISDPLLTECPICGQPALKKQLSVAGFRLKGGGWYETDFKKDNQKNLHDSGDKTPAAAAPSVTPPTSASTEAAKPAASTAAESKPAP
jgi:putative FmdB family regulatory protein